LAGNFGGAGHVAGALLALQGVTDENANAGAGAGKTVKLGLTGAYVLSPPGTSTVNMDDHSYPIAALLRRATGGGQVNSR
jgi:hypothetical protein